MKISSKRQVAIPKRILETLRLKPGDEIEFVIEGNTAKIVPIKTIRVPRDQAWFWTPEWQEKEKEADEDIRKERYQEFENVEDLLKDIHGEN
ncbi:MAG: AbrB/MazE/SpoVT family DNA-binding domain-containing protein [Desulfovibrionales bacterium]|nr:AbrB/MazE/SpoVT family DNA-binding domain-containing protein [Desulfovibrionales bacterium]